jgi:hypothetical protein
MKETIQNKIQQVLMLAKTPVNKSTSSARATEDSLSKVIRNPVEAAIFIAELNAAIKAAQSK